MMISKFAGVMDSSILRSAYCTVVYAQELCGLLNRHTS
jgi:hypothetical protein